MPRAFVAPALLPPHLIHGQLALPMMRSVSLSNCLVATTLHVPHAPLLARAPASCSGGAPTISPFSWCYDGTQAKHKATGSIIGQCGGLEKVKQKI